MRSTRPLEAGHALARALGFALLLAGCELLVGDPPPPDAQGATNLAEGSTCTCFDLSSNCCATGLFCDLLRGHQVTQPDGSSRTESTCTKKRAVGETCLDARECAEPLAFCAGPAGGPARCQVNSAELDAQRCDQSNQCSSADGIHRICVESYCKRMVGEPCTSAPQCESGSCGATSSRCI